MRARDRHGQDTQRNGGMKHPDNALWAVILVLLLVLGFQNRIHQHRREELRELERFRREAAALTQNVKQLESSLAAAREEHANLLADRASWQKKSRQSGHESSLLRESLRRSEAQRCELKAALEMAQPKKPE